MEALTKAVADLETSLAKAPNEAVRQHLQSAVAAMRTAIDAHRDSAPASDKLAKMNALPEALLSCKPPSVATSAPSTSEAVGPLPPALSPELAEGVKSWTFDLHKIPFAELPALCFGAMMQHPEMAKFLPPLSLSRLWKYVQVVASRYRDNPFHSFRHAVDVTLAASCMVRWTQEAYPDLLNDLQVCARAGGRTTGEEGEGKKGVAVVGVSRLWPRVRLGGSETLVAARSADASLPAARVAGVRGAHRRDGARHRPPRRHEQLPDRDEASPRGAV